MHKDINVNVSGPVQPSSQYKTVVLKGNLPFASQITEPNMKYVIKHDFDLGGESVTILEGCLLEFDGGSISNGIIISNNTIVCGTYKNSSSVFYGVFHDDTGNILIDNGNNFDDYKAAILTVTNYVGLPSYCQQYQSITSFDEYYIAGVSASGAQSVNSGIIVYDKNFNVVKIGHIIGETHLNSLCTKGSNVYFEFGSVYAYFDIESFISSESTDITPILTAANNVGGLSYDKESDRFVAINYSTMTVFDGELHRISSADMDILGSLKEIYPFMIDDARFAIQDCHCKKGIFFVNVIYSTYISYTRYLNLVIAIDIKDMSVAGCHNIDYIDKKFEIQGICDDVENSEHYILSGALLQRGAMLSFTKKDNLFTTLQYLYEDGRNLTPNLFRTELYVDNTYIGKSIGDSHCPFKSIQDAIAFLPDDGFGVIYVKGTNVIYNVGSINLSGKKFEIRAIEANSKPKININLTMYNSEAVFLYIDFVGTSSIFCQLCTFLIRSCTVDIEEDGATTFTHNFITCQCSKIYTDNVTINKCNAYIDIDRTVLSTSNLSFNKITLYGNYLIRGNYAGQVDIAPMVCRESVPITFGTNSKLFGAYNNHTVIYTFPITVYASNYDGFYNICSSFFGHIGGNLENSGRVLVTTSKTYKSSTNGVYNFAGTYLMTDYYQGTIIATSASQSTTIAVNNDSNAIESFNKPIIGTVFVNNKNFEFGFFTDNNINGLRRYDGSTMSAKRSGTWDERPNSVYKVYEGFKYMINDGTNHFPIYAHINGSTVKWYKADGTQYTG